jgi:hypothetical protein
MATLTLAMAILIGMTIYHTSMRLSEPRCQYASQFAGDEAPNLWQLRKFAA